MPAPILDTRVEEIFCTAMRRTVPGGAVPLSEAFGLYNAFCEILAGAAKEHTLVCIEGGEPQFDFVGLRREEIIARLAVQIGCSQETCRRAIADFESELCRNFVTDWVSVRGFGVFAPDSNRALVLSLDSSIAPGLDQQIA